MRKINRKKFIAAIASALMGISVATFPSGTQAAKVNYTLADAQMILKIALNIEKYSGSADYDFDGDGRVSLLDAQLCLKYALHIVAVPDVTPQPSDAPQASGIPASSMEPLGSEAPASWVPAESTAPSYSALPEVSETPSPVPSLLPEESDEPSEVPMPASAVPTVYSATPAPVPAQASQTAPSINTQEVMLYTGNSPAGTSNNSIVLYNTGFKDSESIHSEIVTAAGIEDSEMWKETTAEQNGNKIKIYPSGILTGEHHVWDGCEPGVHADYNLYRVYDIQNGSIKHTVLERFLSVSEPDISEKNLSFRIELDQYGQKYLSGEFVLFIDFYHPEDNVNPYLRIPVLVTIQNDSVLSQYEGLHLNLTSAS